MLVVVLVFQKDDWEVGSVFIEWVGWRDRGRRVFINARVDGQLVST